MSIIEEQLLSELELLKKQVTNSQTFSQNIQQDQAWRLHFYLDLKKAKKHLTNFTVRMDIRKKRPTYGEISFYHENLSMYETLKMFAWEYGFVVPVKWSKDKKVLRGEKRLKYV